MKAEFSIKVSKKDLNKAIRALSIGYNIHRNISTFYQLAFVSESTDILLLKVLGAEYRIPAEIEGNGAFSLSYKHFKLILRSCKNNRITMKITSSHLIFNKTYTLKVFYCKYLPDIPITVGYTYADLLRINWNSLDKNSKIFWNMTAQLENAKKIVEEAIEKTYFTLNKHLPVSLTQDTFKMKIRKDILGYSDE